MTTAEKTRRAAIDWWARGLAVLALAVPFVSALATSCSTERVKESDNRVRYVELAIGVLRTSPTPDTSAVREWAIDILNEHSTVKLSSAAKVQLKTHVLEAHAMASASARGELSVVPK
jgi:hypothetical protein